MSFYTPTAPVAPRPDRPTLLPMGKYRATIVAATKKPTKANDGHFLELELQVIEGEHKGRKVWERLNLWNRNATAVQIAQEAMNELLFVLGLTTVQQTSDLMGKSLVMDVGIRKGKDGQDQQTIKRFFKDTGPGTTGAATPAAPAAAAKPATPKPGAAPNWATAAAAAKPAA